MNRVFKILLLLFVYHFSFSQEKYSLSQCIGFAEKNSPQASQLPLIEQNANLQNKILKSAYLPQSSLGGSATWQSDVTSLPIKIPNMTVPTPPQDQYKATVDLVQNIWDGGLTSGQKNAASAQAKLDVQKVNLDVYAVRDQVSALFFGVLLSEKLTENTKILLEEISAKMNKAKAGVQNGVATNSNYLQLEAKYLELSQQLTEAQLRKKSALEALSLLTGKSFKDTDTFMLPAEISLSGIEIQRPELSFFDSQKEFLDANKSLVKAKNLPKISAFGTGGYGKPGLNFLASEFKTYFIGGVQLKVPLSYLYAGSQKNEIQQIEINKKKVDSQKEAFLMGTNIKLSNQKAEIERLESLLKSDERIVEIRTKIKQTADAQLTNGVITTSDYLTELNNENLARQTHAVHQVQYQQAKVNLRIIVGEKID